MRGNRLSLFLLLLCSSPLYAEDRWTVSVLAAEMSNEQTTVAGLTSNEEVHPGVSVGIAYAIAPQWDAEFTIATQSHRSAYTRLFYTPTPDGTGVTFPAHEFRDYRVQPLELSLTRRFRDAERIRPYVRLGVRYVKAPDDPNQSAPTFPIYDGGTNVPFVQVHEGYGFEDRTSVQAGAGLLVRVTDHTAVRAEAMRLLRFDKADYDPVQRYAVGLSWMF